MKKAVFNVDDVDWEGTLLQLTAFAHSLASSYNWFRGEDTSVFRSGKEAVDYATEAITTLLANPEKYEPEKGDFLNYLKYSVIRNLVRNDARSPENRLTDDIYKWDDNDDDESSVPYSERIMPLIAASFPEDIDYKAIKDYVQKEIAGDSEMEEVFLGTYLEGMKRVDVIRDFNMSDKTYDNAHRRLKTVFKKAAKHFSQTKPA